MQHWKKGNSLHIIFLDKCTSQKTKTIYAEVHVLFCVRKDYEAHAQICLVLNVSNNFFLNVTADDFKSK